MLHLIPLKMQMRRVVAVILVLACASYSRRKQMTVEDESYLTTEFVDGQLHAMMSDPDFLEAIKPIAKHTQALLADGDFQKEAKRVALEIHDQMAADPEFMEKVKDDAKQMQMGMASDRLFQEQVKHAAQQLKIQRVNRRTKPINALAHLLAQRAGRTASFVSPSLVGSSSSHRLYSTRPLRAAVSKMQMDNEEVDFEFDFSDDGAETQKADTETKIEDDESMTEKQKEIARLRAAEKFMRKANGNAVCTNCNYNYDWEKFPGSRTLPKLVPFEMVPDEWKCPQCGVPKGFFEPSYFEVAGFEENQGYGLGTNAMTEGDKSNLIFGGLAAAFALLIAGYGLN
jgi:rubredoxin